MSTKKKIPPVLILVVIALVALWRLYAIAGGMLPPMPGVDVAPLDSTGKVPASYLPSGGSTSIPGRLANTTTVSVNVKDFGAKCDGTADDTSALSAAMTYCESTGKSLTLSGTIKITHGITVDYTKFSLYGYGATLNAAAVSGVAITLRTTGGSGQFYDAQKYEWSGLEVVGARTSGHTAIQFGDGTNTASHTNFRDVSIHGFDKIFTWSNHAYENKFINGQFYDANDVIVYPSGLADSGEQITFTNCALFNSTRLVTNTGGNFSFIGGAMDYFGNYAVSVVSGGIVRLNNTHVETNTDNDYWFKTSGSYSNISLASCPLVITGSRTYELGSGGNSDGGITVTDSGPSITSGTYSPKSWFTGTVNISTPMHYATSASDMRLWNVNHNILSDGGFEASAAPSDEWSVTAGSSVDAPARVSSASHSGTYSLKFTTSGAGRTSSVTKTMTVQPGAKPTVLLYLKNSFSNMSDIFTVTEGYSGLYNSGTITAPTNVYTYKQGGKHFANWSGVYSRPFTAAPPGATAFYVTLTQNNTSGTSSTWVDDAAIEVLDSSAFDITRSYIPVTDKGAVNGVAPLDNAGKVPSSCLPSGGSASVDITPSQVFCSGGTTEQGQTTFDASQGSNFTLNITNQTELDLKPQNGVPGQQISLAVTGGSGPCMLYLAYPFAWSGGLFSAPGMSGTCSYLGESHLSIPAGAVYHFSFIFDGYYWQNVPLFPTGNGSGLTGITKSQVGLGNVTNDAQVKRSEMGAANGVAALDGSGRVVQDLAKTGQYVNWAVGDSHFPPRYRMMSSLTVRSYIHPRKSGAWARFGFPGGSDGPITYKSQRFGGYSTNLTVYNNMLLTFGGYSTATVPAGQVLYCDPIAAAIVAGNHYAVTGYQTGQAVQDIGLAYGGTPHYYSQSQFEYGNVSWVNRTLARNALNNNGDSRYFGPVMEVLTNNPAYTDTYYVFGDSIAEGGGASGPNKSWPALLGATANVHNASISGWTVMQEAAIIANRTFNGMTPVKVIDALDSNDRMNYSGNGWTSETLDQIKAAHLALWNYWHNQGCRVLVVQTGPRDFTTNQTLADSAKNDLNAWKYQCYDAGLVDGVIDMDTPLRGATPDSRNTSLFFDTAHPNDSGHAAMFAAIGSVNATMEALKALDTQTAITWYVDGTNGYDVPGYGFASGTPAKTVGFLLKLIAPRMHKAELTINVAGGSPIYLSDIGYMQSREFTNASTAAQTGKAFANALGNRTSMIPPYDNRSTVWWGMDKKKHIVTTLNAVFSSYTSAPACYAGPTPPANTRRYPEWTDTTTGVKHSWDGTGWFALDGHGDVTVHIRQNGATDNVLNNRTACSTYVYAQKYLLPKENTGKTTTVFENVSSQNMTFTGVHAQGGVYYQCNWTTLESLSSQGCTDRSGATNDSALSTHAAWTADGTAQGTLDDYIYANSGAWYRPIIAVPTIGHYLMETAGATATDTYKVYRHATVLKNCNITVGNDMYNWTIGPLSMRGTGTGITYNGSGSGTLKLSKLAGYTYCYLGNTITLDNNILDSAGAGIRLQGGSTQAMITNNNIRNGNYALIASSNARIYFAGNRVAGQSIAAVVNYLYISTGAQPGPVSSLLQIGSGLTSGYNSIVDYTASSNTGGFALDWEYPGTCQEWGANGYGASRQLYGGNASNHDYRTFGDPHTPADNEMGLPGFQFWDASYWYLCTAVNTWRRAAISSY